MKIQGKNPETGGKSRQKLPDCRNETEIDGGKNSEICLVGESLVKTEGEFRK